MDETVTAAVLVFFGFAGSIAAAFAIARRESSPLKRFMLLLGLGGIEAIAFATIALAISHSRIESGADSIWEGNRGPVLIALGLFVWSLICASAAASAKGRRRLA